jgi:RNA polymerase sigma-70 factor (ECF subfamily)
MLSIAAGDLPAFERLYRLYEKRVFQYVYGLVYDTTLAEDVTGEAMMAVWKGAVTFAGTSRVSTWIFGIARHKALDALRRSGRHVRDVALEEAADLPAPQDCPTDTLYRKQNAAVLRSALKTLSREHQEVLRLVFYEELPYEEIAALLSIPVNTVKTRVYYAKQQLKLQLERLGDKDGRP